jgi:hypothetical protein
MEEEEHDCQPVVRIAAKLSAAGLATKAGVGLTMAAASVTGGAAAGVLPEPVSTPWPVWSPT